MEVLKFTETSWFTMLLFKSNKNQRLPSKLSYLFLLQSTLHSLGVSPFNVQIKPFLFLYITILTAIIIKFQQYTVHHSYSTSQKLDFSAVCQPRHPTIHLRYRIHIIKSPCWLDLPHPIMYHMSCVIPLFKNLYRLMKYKCYCVCYTTASEVV